jgi:hypothetical protein
MFGDIVERFLDDEKYIVPDLGRNRHLRQLIGNIEEALNQAGTQKSSGKFVDVSAGLALD